MRKAISVVMVFLLVLAMFGCDTAKDEPVWTEKNPKVNDIQGNPPLSQNRKLKSPSYQLKNMWSCQQIILLRKWKRLAIVNCG